MTLKGRQRACDHRIVQRTGNADALAALRHHGLPFHAHFGIGVT